MRTQFLALRLRAVWRRNLTSCDAPLQRTQAKRKQYAIITYEAATCGLLKDCTTTSRVKVRRGNIRRAEGLRD